ncbi:Uncharacterised protein [uncultured archaeon]|nr:Uncharacterised protein [uncultured archaeon]
MLETSQERVKLLKAGITGKTIERLYIVENNFKIVRCPIFLDFVEIGTNESKNTVIKQESIAESGLPGRTGVNHPTQILQPVGYQDMPAKKGHMVI